MKALAPGMGSGIGVHMCYLEVFFQEGSALWPLSNCTLRDGDLQMLNMQIAAFHSQMRQYSVQIKHQHHCCVTGNQLIGSLILSPPGLWSSLRFSLIILDPVWDTKVKKGGGKKKKESTCRLDYKETLSPRSGVLIQC